MTEEDQNEPAQIVTNVTSPEHFVTGKRYAVVYKLTHKGKFYDGIIDHCGYM